MVSVWAKLDATWSIDDEVPGDISSSDGEDIPLAIQDGSVAPDEPDGEDGVDSEWEEEVGSTQKQPEVPFSSYYTDDDEDEDVPQLSQNKVKKLVLLKFLLLKIHQ